jgi:hypothetical protein
VQPRVVLFGIAEDTQNSGSAVSDVDGAETAHADLDEADRSLPRCWRRPLQGAGGQLPGTSSPGPDVEHVLVAADIGAASVAVKFEEPIQS